MNIKEFPDTLTLFIFSFLSETDLCRVAQTCKSWRLIAYDSSLWKSVNLKRFHKLNEICLMKVIRSRMVPLLYKLNLGGFTLSPRVFHVLVKHCPRLRVLCLESATFVEDFMDKPESFPENLTKLDIRHSSGHPSAFRVISHCFHTSQCLGLSDPFFESLPSIQELHRVFASLQTVRILEFSYCSLLTDQIVRYIAENCRNLKSLCLRRCNNIEGESLPALIDNCSSLTSLVLDGTSVTDDAVRAVRWERSAVTEVDLSWCRHLTQDGLQAMLPKCRFLRYLRLCCCGYGHAITDGVLNAMTKKSSSLQVLDLSYSSEVTNTALGRFVASCPSLLYLRVYHCQLLTSALMNLIPNESRVFVVANFFTVQRGGLVTSIGSDRPWALWSAPVNYSRTVSLDQSLQQD
ncbi:F-box/LRR-repeat protein 20-like [Montipora foliosa]|uniref:F-box/LRR-repeat protein 20-like n=1 Tax=Montipora foliosa TaxID=591990 RepID=UPI0035F206CB